MKDKEKEYRVVKVTRKNGDISWMVQKKFKSWISGRVFWKYYENNWESSRWTRNVYYGEEHATEEEAVEKMKLFIHRDNSAFREITVVNSLKTDCEGNVYVTYGTF